jgi:hypothetical protein
MIVAIQSGLAGLAAQQRRFESAARQVARQGYVAPGAGDPHHASGPARPIVEALSARAGHAANLKTIQIADRMLGSLVDVLA